MFTPIPDNTRFAAQMHDFEVGLSAQAEVIGFQIYQLDQANPMEVPEVGDGIKLNTLHEATVYVNNFIAAKLGVAVFIERLSDRKQFGPLSLGEATVEVTE